MKVHCTTGIVHTGKTVIGSDPIDHILIIGSNFGTGSSLLNSIDNVFGVDVGLSFPTKNKFITRPSHTDGCFTR